MNRWMNEWISQLFIYLFIYENIAEKSLNVKPNGIQNLNIQDSFLVSDNSNQMIRSVLW